MPSPPCVSPATQATTRSPARRMPERRMASAVMMMLASPPFMFCTPWPYRRSPSRLGVHGSRFHRRVSALMSVWPFSMRLAPPPVPRRVAIVWKRPGSISCRSTSYPRARKSFSRNSATGVSSVLKLGMRMRSLASSIRPRASTCASTARVGSSIARRVSHGGEDQTKVSGSTWASPRAKRPMSSGPASIVTARPWTNISAMSWPAIGPCMKPWPLNPAMT